MGGRSGCPNLVDEFTREALATTAARSFTADDTTVLLDKVIASTGRRPAHLRMDNGPRTHRRSHARLVPFQHGRHRLHRTVEHVQDGVARF